MTVSSRCTFFVFVLFLGPVCSIYNPLQENITTSRPTCTYPYSCISTSECAERHSAEGTDEVLFQCEEKKKVCCPPIKSFAPDSSVLAETSTHRTTEKSVVDTCAQCSYEYYRPQSVSVDPTPVKREPAGVHRHEPTQKPVQPDSGFRRPPSAQPQEGRRPGFSQPQPQTQRPNQQGFTQRPNQQGFSQPQSQTQRPNQQGFTQPQPQSQTQRPNQPNFPQPQPQTQRPHTHRPEPQPLSQSPLTSHRNFRFLPAETECGVNNFANRITEGEEVSLGEYPWMVLTGVKDKFGNYRWNCGGTLINGWYVLTAAHCLVVDNRTIEFVRLGEHNLLNETDCSRELCLDPPEDVTIAEVIPHEKWNTTTIKNDIALLRLSRNPLLLGKSNIYPICLPFDLEKLNITSSTKYEVAGWGKTDWNADEGSDVLRKASLSGVNREECNICKDKKKQQYCPIVDSQLCVQGWKSVDVCKGDSGGPLMISRLNVYQIGITSFKGSEYCGAENIPSIFTKVASYLPWILDNIKQ